MRHAWILALLVLSAPAQACDMAAASPWIGHWFEAWDLTSRDIMHLPAAPAPDIVFFDSACVYTTSKVTAPSVRVADGPRFGKQKLSWRVAAHGDTLTLPNANKVRVGLLSFAGSDRATGPFFVMAGPDLWSKVGSDENPGLPVFLHEFTHTRQIAGMKHIIGPIDSAWTYPEELDDDAVQTHFKTDSTYVKEYLAERDLFYLAAAAESRDSMRALAKKALQKVRERHARWFVGDKAVFATLDDTWLSLEGAAQWAAYAWLSHPRGGGMEPTAAAMKMVGRRRFWVQDEGLAIFLVVDRLLPSWPTLVFHEPSAGVLALLEQATK